MFRYKKQFLQTKHKSQAVRFKFCAEIVFRQKLMPINFQNFWSTQRGFSGDLKNKKVVFHRNMRIKKWLL